MPEKEFGTPLIIFSRSPFEDSLRHACRETWLSALRPEIRPFFLVSCPDLEVEERLDGDLLRVRCEEKSLPDKTRRGLRAVFEKVAFPWLYICNESCWINPWRFNAYPFWDWDVTGGWESGNGAISLSRRAAGFLLDSLEAGTESSVEEILASLPAARVLQPANGISPRMDSREACLVTPGISSRDAMKDLHAKALRHEMLAGLAQPPPQAVNGFPSAPASKSETRRPRESRDLPRHGRIFVQIAAYRETDLVPTLRDLFSKAADSSRLRVGICWQHSEDESLEEFAGDLRLRIDDIPAREAKGLGWARSRVQRLYQDEEFVLQIDGHSRFIEEWDKTLIGMLAETGSPKPILTTYPQGFEPGKPRPQGKPHSISVSYFRENGTWNQFPAPLKSPESLSQPLPARSLAGGFYFTLGRHCREVPYDPSIYFSDENSMAVRSFTHGYDLFHPHRHLLWHHYSRESAPHHWEDHTEEARRAGSIGHFWWLREWRSVMQHQQLFGQADYGITIRHGFGSERSVADFERFAGFDFRGRKLHLHTLAGNPPPVPYEGEENWQLAMKCVIRK